MSGRTLIIAVMGIILATSVILYNIGASSTKITQNFDNYYLRQNGQNAAQSGVNVAITQLGIDPTWRTGFTNLSMLGSTVTISVRDTTFLMGSPGVSTPVVRIFSVATTKVGSLSTRNDTSIGYVQKRAGPPGLKASVTTNGPTQIAGGYTIDGRDHDTLGNLIANKGILGVWTSQSTFSQQGSSTIGGTGGANGTTDYTPAQNPVDTPAVRVNQPYPGGYPTTPDSVFGGTSYGYPEGTLKAFAQSGAAGSQYVTNPATLKFPLAGVTYIELPAGGTWGSKKVTSNLVGSGVVILHNATRDATITNGVNKGTFVGLVIADDASSLNSTLIGAIVCLSTNPPVTNPHIGTGNGMIKYSKQAIDKAVGPITNPVRGQVLAWWEP